MTRTISLQEWDEAVDQCLEQESYRISASCSLCHLVNDCKMCIVSEASFWVFGNTYFPSSNGCLCICTYGRTKKEVTLFWKKNNVRLYLKRLKQWIQGMMYLEKEKKNG